MNIQGLYIDRKLLSILSIFVILGVCLVTTLILTTKTLSAVRAYSTLQTYWTESRKDATYELNRYLETKEVEHLEHFDEALTFIRNARDVRDELLVENPDYALVEEKLISIHTQPRDINDMIFLFEHFHTLDHLSDAVQIWKEASLVIEELEQIGTELLATANSDIQDQAFLSHYENRISELEAKLVEQTHLIAASLSEGTHLATNILIGLGLALGGILLLFGILLSYSFLKNLKMWAKMIDMSEQRYKSLFEQNPNIVLSLTKQGYVASGNDAFYKISGYSEEDVKARHVNSFPLLEDKKVIEKRFQEVISGKSQNFEVRWKRKSGEIISLHATVLPIRIDNSIEGVFVIAEDVSYQKFAEEKIKAQLKEKISLVSEVHDRVKNNLALISSMLQLQEDYLDDEIAKKYLDSTISRIQSLAMVHEKLYQTESFSNVRLDEFIKDLSASARKNFRQKNTDLNIIINAHPVTLDIKQAIPVGLLLNEILMNAFKYAFIGRKSGEIRIELFEAKDVVEIKIQDDGIGLPKNFNFEDITTLGMTLIRILSSQLNAEVQLQSKYGTTFTMKFSQDKGMLMSA